MLVHWFHLHMFAFGERPLFRAPPPLMESTIFEYLHIVLASVHLYLYLIMSLSQSTFKPELSPYFCLVLEGRHICFWWSDKNIWDLHFFSSHDRLTYNKCFGLTHQMFAGCFIDSVSAFSYYFFSSLNFPGNLPPVTFKLQLSISCYM